MFCVTFVLMKMKAHFKLAFTFDECSLQSPLRFLPGKQLEDFFYMKVILSSVTYGLIVWGSCNKTHINNLEILHARAAGRIVYGLPWDISPEDVLTRTGWGSLETMHKVRLTEFVFQCIKDYTVAEFRVVCTEEFRTQKKLRHHSSKTRNEFY